MTAPLPPCEQPCSLAVFHNQAYFLSLFDRLYPPGYLDPLKSPGPGYELLQAYAALFERLSLAVARIDCGDHILQSFGAVFSTATVTFTTTGDFSTSPDWGGDGSVQILAGTVVTTSRGDRRFTTLASMSFLNSDPGTVGAIALQTTTSAAVDAVQTTIPVINNGTDGFPTNIRPDSFSVIKIENEYIAYLSLTTGVGASFTSCIRGWRPLTNPAAAHPAGVPVTLYFTQDLGFDVIPVLATQPAFEFNVPGPVTIKNGDVLPGEIDTIQQLIANPIFPVAGFPNFITAQVTTATCGRAPLLDALGADRGLPRHDGETDDSYKNRIRTLPDVVTPDAIEAAIGRVLGPIGTVTTWPPDFPSQALFFDFIETWEIDYQTAWDCPSPTYPTTTLQVALTNVATTATVLNTVGYPATGVIQIDNERMTYTGITSISFTGLTRGAGGTVAVAHAINASVNMAGTPTTAVGISPKIPTDLFVYDPDAIPGHDIYPFNNRWLSEEDFRGAFIVVVPNYPAITDVGMVYDDTASFPFDFLTYNDAAVNIGQRSYSAYDLDVFFSIEGPNNRTLTGGGYDGFDLGKQAVYKGLASQLQRVKAGGVLAVIELQGE